MEDHSTALQTQKVITSLNSDEMQLQKLEKSIQLLRAAKDFIPLIEESLQVAKSVFDSFLQLEKIIVTLDHKLADNRDRRDALMRAFQNCIDHLQKTTNVFLKEIELAEDERSKDRYASLLIDVLDKSQHLTLQLLKII